MQALTPVTAFDGPVLEFDLAGVEVGVAEYDEGPTGCTVLRFPDGAGTSVDIRGGMVGSVGDYGFNHAICLAGGSLPGLEAAAGVSAALHEHLEGPLRFGQESPFRFVSGAIIYDFSRRDTAIYPDHALGYAAARATRPGRFPLGRRGAGRSAAAGKLLYGDTGSEDAGQGAAFGRAGEARVLACTVVNAVGAVLDRAGRVVAGHRDPATGERRRAIDGLADGRTPAGQPGENTTLTVVVTDARMSADALKQLGRQVHASMARAIDPFNSSTDGDVLYAVSTGAVEDAPHPDAIGVVAAELAWDAVLAAVTTR